MNKMFFYGLLALGLQGYAMAAESRTEALHAEARENANPNLTQETHPVLYAMIQDLVQEAQVDMPRYISTYDAEGMAVTRNGAILKKTNAINAWVDVAGDLYICREILTNLSYEQVRGVIALALAEKAANRPLKLTAVGCGSFIATAALLYAANKRYKLHLGDWVWKRSRSDQEMIDRLESLFFITALPAALITKIVSNNMQKAIDKAAARITSNAMVIGAIQSLVSLRDRYMKEDFFSRMATKLKLKSLYNTLFYPIRAFTDEERVRYLGCSAE